MIQPLSEANHICQTIQVPFDRMLYSVLEKYYSFPAFTLLLGSLCQHMNTEQPYTFGASIVASSYFVQQWGNGHILDDTGLSGAYGINPEFEQVHLYLSTKAFFSYLTGFLKNPEQLGS